MTLGIIRLFFSRLQLHELEDRLYNDSILDVILLPPEDGDITDEESGDEAEIDINRLPPRMLQSEVEVTFDEKPEQIENALEQIGNASSEINAVHNKKNIKNIKSKEKPVYKWKNNSLKKFRKLIGRGDNDETKVTAENNNFTPVDCFEKFFTDEVYELIMIMSNTYALQQNHALELTVEEIKVYIGILLLTGYMTPKYMRMFWEVKSDTHNKTVASSMRRNRFFEIQKYLHLSDNFQLPENDKYAKVRKYFDLLNACFIKNFELVFSSHISLDETMIPYYGRHGLKQHIHGKPIRFGYKLWSAATHSGYLISFEPYQGARSAPLPLQDIYGLGAAVILELESRLPKAFGPYNLYYDNYFSSFPLLMKLTERNTGGTGTIRSNRLAKCPIIEDKILKKEKRGSFSYCNTENCILLKWHDNNIVTIASNCHGILPIRKVDRIGTVQKKRMKLQIECPSVIQMYNKYMGGVDRFDENVASMRVGLRGKKWWFPLFAFGIDAACQNAWIVMKTSNKKLTYCDFRRNIVQVYLSKFAQRPRKSTDCGSSLQKRVLSEVRLAGNSSDHLPENCSQRRCANCRERTRKLCKKCNVGLHIHCWYEFHSKQ